MKKYLFLFAASIMVLSCLLGKTLVTASGEERESGYDRYYTPTLRSVRGTLCGPLLKDTGLTPEWRSASIYQN